MSTDLNLGLRPDDELPPRERRRSVRTQLGRGLVLALILVALLAVAAAAILGVRTVARMLTAGDYTGNGTGSVTVQVRTGDTATDIAATLAEAHVIKSAEAFRRAAGDESRSAQIQPGFYRLRSQMSASAALAMLLEPSSRVSVRVTLPEGLRLTEALPRIASATKIRLSELTAAAANTSQLGLPPQCQGQLEGCLFPATYSFPPGISADDALRQMVERFGEAAAAVDLDRGAKALRLTPYQVVIVASLLEREARLAGDYPRVARVTYNRLAAKMPLQLDSTVNYALGTTKTRITTRDTQTPSRYNTYLHRGLPPTPINSPGEMALQAALHPAAGNWMYFVTIDKSGRSAFAASYPQFLKLKAAARRSGVL